MRKNTAIWLSLGLLLLLGLVTSLYVFKIIKPPPLEHQPQFMTTQEELLVTHNRYRQEVGVHPLYWDTFLEAEAKLQADYLAANGVTDLINSGRSLHGNNLNGAHGQNIWFGTANRFSPSDAVNSWGREKENFKRGIFPDVSTTGKWEDVGHYTQVVSTLTNYVGCAKATDLKNNLDIWVCNYNPQGNMQGSPIY